MNKTNSIRYCRLFVLSISLFVGLQSSSAQDDTGTPTLLPIPDFQFSGFLGKTYLDSDPAQFPQSLQAPQGAPNILLILLDDAGFGQFSTFGGGVPSPTMDKLAAEGLSYNRFHTTALCSPTRAALITGRNHHSTSFGGNPELAKGYDGYSCILPKHSGTVAEVLKQNGYMTAMIGKNHTTPTWELSQAGPFDRWPNGLGFDYFYGFNGGDMNHWNPILLENHHPVSASLDPSYHLTSDLSEHAISWVRQVKTIAPDKPFFLYVAPGATHAPHHAPQEWIDKFKGRFDGGWDSYREQTIERQKKLGVVPANTKLTSRSEGLPAWDTLQPEQKRLYAHMMEVFAGYGAHCDYEMGKIIEAVKQLPGSDNTLIIYIAGDNGASAEGGLEGSLNENLLVNGFPEKWQDNLKAIDELGGPKHYNHFSSAWAHAMNTPFQWTKQSASHFGGTRTPMIISWPSRIKEKGILRNQFIHVVDIVPTIYEACGISTPVELNGVLQKPIEGISFEGTFIDSQAKQRKTQYFEIGANRGMYHDGWMASALAFPSSKSIHEKFDLDSQNWELYDVTEDFSQSNNLAAEYPQKLRQMQDMWWVEAGKYNVLPLDWRMNNEPKRPNLTTNRATTVYYPGTIGLPDAASPIMTNKSWTITADIEVPEKGANGMIITHGGLDGGYGLYLHNNKPCFSYNYFSIEHPMFASKEGLLKGKNTIVVDFVYDGGAGMGKGGKIILKANGKTIAEGRLERTIPVKFSMCEGLDIGMDIGSAVDYTYKTPYTFTGKIEKVTIELK